MKCSNCGQTMADHCTVHLVPCCPGICSGRVAPPAPRRETGDRPPLQDPDGGRRGD